MPKRQIPKRDKLIVAARAKFRCEYCQCLKAVVPVPFRTDHIIPESKGGSSGLENLAYACDACNGHKYQKMTAVDPQTGLESALFHPRKDMWTEHFKWSEDTLYIEGLTAAGRATVDELHMNREALINLRFMLLKFKKHPPEGTF